MGRPLRLPDDFDAPDAVNGWRFDPEPYNGRAWRGPDDAKTVAVIAHLGTARAVVIDERASGFENRVEIASTSYETAAPEDSDPYAGERAAGAAMVEQAVAWMQETPPDAWTHPDVNEAVFDAPPGYDLAAYYLESRTTTVYYRRRDADPAKRLAGAGEPDAYTPATCPYLYVHVWTGSGEATVALAPWEHAHGPGSKHPEIEPVVEPPAECGLDVALAMARQWAREHVAADAETAAASDAAGTAAAPEAVGQTALQQYGEVRDP